MADPRLVNYIKAQLAAGQNIEAVRRALLAQGWQEKDIAEAISAAAAVPLPAAPNARKSRKWLKIGIVATGVILIVLAVIGMFIL